MITLKDFRRKYQPLVSKVLQDLTQVTVEKEKETSSASDVEKIKKLFPHSFGKPLVSIKKGGKTELRALRIGVVLSGGQAPGGHNVIAGLYDAIKRFDAKSTLIGFLDGPGGIVEGKYKEIEEETLKEYRNEGGFNLIGAGRTKIETPEQLEASLNIAQKLKLDGLVVIGGDDSNTNAAVLAEYFSEKGCNTAVIGVPKTIDGDLKNAYVDVSFGFDTACKTYCEMIGNIGRDALSSRKYYHFIRLMGRSASHIVLECALKIRPNAALIGEEILERNWTLSEIRDFLCGAICKRVEKGINHGLILIPEGLVEFIPEIKALIQELNLLLSTDAFQTDVFQELSPMDKAAKISTSLQGETKRSFDLLPNKIKDQLLLERDPHGNVQVSKINTEDLLIELVTIELKRRKEIGEFKGKFRAVGHFFGYEGRSGYPSNFDSNYCYSLGLLAALLIKEDCSGYMAAISGLTRPVDEWSFYGVPITSLMNIEVRHGKEKPVIQKALVDLKGKAFAFFEKNRQNWLYEDVYKSPGPIQFFGETSITEVLPETLLLDKNH